jgi:hypothetical protein
MSDGLVKPSDTKKDDYFFQKQTDETFMKTRFDKQFSQKSLIIFFRQAVTELKILLHNHYM